MAFENNILSSKKYESAFPRGKKVLLIQRI